MPLAKTVYALISGGAPQPHVPNRLRVGGLNTTDYQAPGSRRGQEGCRLGLLGDDAKNEPAASPSPCSFDWCSPRLIDFTPTKFDRLGAGEA